MNGFQVIGLPSLGFYWINGFLVDNIENAWACACCHGVASLKNHLTWHDTAEGDQMLHLETELSVQLEVCPLHASQRLSNTNIPIHNESIVCPSHSTKTNARGSLQSYWWKVVSLSSTQWRSCAWASINDHGCRCIQFHLRCYLSQQWKFLETRKHSFSFLVLLHFGVYKHNAIPFRMSCSHFSLLLAGSCRRC